MKVLVTGRLPQAELELLRELHEVEANELDRPMPSEVILEKIGDKEGLLCMLTDLIDEKLMDHAPRLKMIANYAVGYNNIDLDEATARGIPVSNTPDVLTEATAELAFALILAVSRRVIEGDRMTREGRFQAWAPLHFLGCEVTGKSLGIVGLGRIGRALARKAQGFDMPVYYHNRKPLSEDDEERLGVSYLDLKTLLARCDFISLHVPLTKETRYLIGREELTLMQPAAYLINTARGPVVDEQALVEALQKKEIAGAGLDVYEHEPLINPALLELENVVLLPHVGSATRETRTKMARMAVENLLTGLRGERPPNCINSQIFAK